MRLLTSTLLVTLASWSCSPPLNLCSRVVCPGNSLCEPASGRCLAADAGAALDAGGDDGGAPDGGAPGAGPSCNPPCPMGEHCDAASNRCVRCLIDAHCACPDPLCVNGFCVRPAPDDGGLKPAPAPSESCAAATPFTFSGCTTPRTYRFRVNLDGRDDERGVCSAPTGGGRDFVYLLRLEETLDLQIDVQPAPGSAAEPVVYVRAMPCTGQELACVGSGAAASITLRSRPKGDYALFLDTLDAAGGGEVEVAVTLAAPTLPPNETCLAWEPIPTDGGVVRVDLSTAVNDEATACNATGVDSRDVAWRFTVDATADIVARAVRADPDAGVSPFVELRQGSCGPGTSRGCAAGDASGRATLRLLDASPGPWFLVVESFDGGAADGPLDVSVSVTPPPLPLSHDTCVAPRDIVFRDGGFYTELDIDTRSARDDENGSCNVAGGAEYVYRLNLLVPRRVTLTAAPAPGSPADPVLYVRLGSCTAGAELGCSDQPNPGATETVGSGMASWAPGDYFIFVEAYGASVGPTRLTVYAGP